MAIKVKATCSECWTTHFRQLQIGEEDIKCPACGHAMKNFPEGELNEMETVCKRQHNRSLIALIAFGVAGICFFVWIFAQDSNVYKFPHQPNEDFLMKAGLPALLIVSLLVSLVFSILGATKRYIIEF